MSYLYGTFVSSTMTKQQCDGKTVTTHSMTGLYHHYLFLHGNEGCWFILLYVLYASDYGCTKI